MFNRYFVLFALLLPVLTLAQNDSDAIEAAKLGIIEKMYDGGADLYRSNLAGRGHSSAEVEDILFGAIDAYALCTALAAQAQAHEQGLSVEIILKGFGSSTKGKEESLVLLTLDTNALKLKTAPCNKALGDKLGVVVQ